MGDRVVVIVIIIITRTRFVIEKTSLITRHIIVLNVFFVMYLRVRVPTHMEKIIIIRPSYALRVYANIYKYTTRAISLFIQLYDQTQPPAVFGPSADLGLVFYLRDAYAVDGSTGTAPAGRARLRRRRPSYKLLLKTRLARYRCTYTVHRKTMNAYLKSDSANENNYNNNKIVCCEKKKSDGISRILRRCYSLSVVSLSLLTSKMCVVFLSTKKNFVHQILMQSRFRYH